MGRQRWRRNRRQQRPIPYDPNKGAELKDDSVDDDPSEDTDTDDRQSMISLTDTDGDGVGDNGDAFPSDSSEDTDADGDGVGDNSDDFPNDRTSKPTAMETEPEIMRMHSLTMQVNKQTQMAMESEIRPMHSQPYQPNADYDGDGYGDNWGNQSWTSMREQYGIGQFVPGKRFVQITVLKTQALQIQTGSLDVLMMTETV